MRRALTMNANNNLSFTKESKIIKILNQEWKKLAVAFFAFLAIHTPQPRYCSPRWTHRLHGPRLLHPESLPEQPAVPRLPGPPPGHPAEPPVPATRPLLLRPRQDARGTGQHPYPPWGKPFQLEVWHENHIRIHGAIFRIERWTYMWCTREENVCMSCSCWPIMLKGSMPVRLHVWEYCLMLREGLTFIRVNACSEK